MLQDKTQIVKIRYYFNDFKQRNKTRFKRHEAKSKRCQKHNDNGMILLTVKKLAALLRGIIMLRCKYHGDCYFLNYLHSFATKKNKLQSH